MTAAITSRAGQLLRDQMTWRRIRLACGLVMFSYLSLHLVMHAMGNVSFAAMQRATLVHDAIWHSMPGTLLLYGAFAIHFSLALWALYARRSFHMGAGELARLVLGFSIVPLLLHHWAAGRWVWSAFGVVRKYDATLTVFFSVVPWWGWRQITVLLIAWTHGCLGIHFWLRHRRTYARFAPVLLAAAVLLPTLSLLGLYQGTRSLLAAEAADPAYLRSIRESGRMGDPQLRQVTFALEDKVYLAYIALVLGVFAARGARTLLERRRGLVHITYPSGQVVRVPIGYPVLEASRRARIPHASICGGRGRCTTCRVRVLRGVEALPRPRASERAALLRIRAAPNVRLACQLRPSRDLSILPLLPANVTASDPRRTSDGSTGNERFVAVMFVDIRRSTALFEKRLPYDVVFLLNCFFDAVAGAVADAGGSPNQFIGDGLMAIFGMHDDARTACRNALAAAGAIEVRLQEMNRRLADELPEPIRIGIGIHAGNVILGEIGYRDRRVITAIGDTVHVAARLQDLTKDYSCRTIVSETVAATAGADLSHCASHEVQVRGRETKLRIRVIDDAASLTTGKTPARSAAA